MILSILTVITVMVTQGWEMGLSELACLMVCISLSFDYSVLFATEYISSRQDTRFLRMEQANKVMGVSCTFSMLTMVAFSAIIN